MNYGFLGAGNMASAIVKGMIKSGFTESGNITIYDTSKDAMATLAQAAGVRTSKSYNALIKASNYLFLAVKPQVLRGLLPEIKDTAKKHNPVIISMAAGVQICDIETLLDAKPPIIRMMPNINALIGESVTAVCSNAAAGEDDLKNIAGLLSAIGQTIFIEERYFGVFTAMASNSPAFTYLFLDSLARAGVLFGMDKKTALQTAARAVIGSCKMLLETDLHPYELIDRVTSPGGSTIEGLCALSEYGFENAVVKAVTACVNKDKALK